jgi:phosphatidylserine synthase 2
MTTTRGRSRAALQREGLDQQGEEKQGGTSAYSSSFGGMSKRKVAAFRTGDPEDLSPPAGTPRRMTRALSRRSPLPQVSSNSAVSSASNDSNFLLRPHTITLLVAMLGYLLYIALARTVNDTDVYANTKYGLLAVFAVFQVIGMLMVSDGPFERPHPIVWRCVLIAGIFYLLVLVFFLFQSIDMTRYLVSLFDPALGVPLKEINYAIDCRLTNWESVSEKLFDFFTFAHATGWFVKTLILRDPWICWIISIMFEVMEYSLMFQLPNFEECWWDHWLLDVLICNAAGIYFGMRACHYFHMKTYDWRAADFPSLLGKVRRAVLPASWTCFHWAATATFKNYLVTVSVVSLFLVAELNAFYLKHLLWIPPNHLLNWIRITLIGLLGFMGTREVYEYFSNPRCTRLGSAAWLCIAVILTEVILILKFAIPVLPFVPPSTVIQFWSAFALLLITYPLYLFALRPRYISKNSI